MTPDQQIQYTVPDPAALDALLTADAAGALPLTGFLDRDGDLWLWSAERERWECYPIEAEPRLHQADEERVRRLYGPLRSIVIHPAEGQADA